MRRRWLLICIIILLAVPLLAQARTVYWQQWNVDIFNIDTSANRFDVTEFYEIRFTGTFRFGSAVIEDTNLEAIQNVQVYQAGQPLQSACTEAPGTYCVRNVQEGTSITYHFLAPITNGTETFELRYTVVGALRAYEGGDQLWWTAIPEEHYGFPIGSSTVTVQLPGGFGPREDIDPVVTYGAPTDIQVDGSTVVAQATRQIGGNERLEIRVQYPHDPDARIADWQSDFDDRRDFEENIKPLLDIGLIILGILLGLGGLLGVFALYRVRGRDPKVGPVPEYLSDTPNDLPPAVVGTLVDERADMRDVLSTIIDLARRGYLVIEENRSEGLFGLGGSSEFTFKRTDKSLNDLREFEQNIMQRVFKGKMERSLEDLKNKFYNYIPDLKNDLYDELVNEKLFTASPETIRNIYSVIGVVIIIAAAALGFFLLPLSEELTPALLVIPVSLGVVGVAFTITGQYMPAKTRKGAEEAAKWSAFRQYLENLERYGKVDGSDTNAIFDRFLPYAVVFGMERSFIRQFTRTAATTGIPIWYYPVYRGGYYSRGYRAGTPLSRGGGGLPSAQDVLPGELARAGGAGGLDQMAGDIAGSLESISDGLTDMLNSAARTFESKPASSGSSGSWSGGGSFGGGSSGGGSRGFG